MHITVNGREMLITDNFTVYDLVTKQGYNPELIVIEHNHEIVNRQEWATILLQPEDYLEVVTFVGGG